jgi:hypothetical protein
MQGATGSFTRKPFSLRPPAGADSHPGNLPSAAFAGCRPGAHRPCRRRQRPANYPKLWMAAAYSPSSSSDCKRRCSFHEVQ